MTAPAVEPLISVCIANYNGARIIEECINSVRGQVDAPPFEIIVHDDASTDESWHVLDRFGDVTRINSEFNVGFCVSNNRMASTARGQYLLLLNNDAVLYPDALRALHEASRADTCGPVLSLPQYEHANGRLLDRGMRMDPFANPVPVTDPGETELAMVMGSCLWISSALWREIGGFPEFIESIGEDLYLCCFARMLGHPIRVTPSSGYRHRVGSSFGGGKVIEQRLSSTLRRRALSERNKTLVMLAFYPSVLLLFILPLHLFLLVFEGAVLAAVRRNIHVLTRIYVPAIATPWRDRRNWRPLRRRIQRSKRIGLSEFTRPIRWLPWKFWLLLKHGFPAIR